MKNYKDNDIYKAAIKYLACGFSIIPVGKNKKPLIEWSEFQRRKASESEVNQWFNVFEFVNIGLVTGKISKVIVVDIENGGKIDDLPKTLMSKTGGGGYHFFYKYTEGIQNSVRIRELTDIRSDGGYVIVPPSQTDKGLYSWANTNPLTEFPKHLFNLKDKPKPFVRTNNLPEYLGANEGGRNNSMAQYAGSLLPLIHPLDWDSLAWPLLRSANMKNVPPLPEDELKSIFTSIMTREKKNPSFRKNLDTHPIVEVSSEDDEVVLMSEVASKQLVRELETFPTGFVKFDDAMCGGFKEGDLVVITAPTGQGKTTFAQTLTCNASQKSVPVLFFSFEVLVRNIWLKFKEMGMSDASVVYSPMKVSSGTIDWVEKRILEAVKKYNIRIVVLDHLGFLLPKKMTYDSQMNSNYSAFLGGICRDLKTLAIKNNLVILLLAHVKKTEKPTINDIRDSSGIAQEADYVFILERQLLTKGKSKDLIDMQYSNDTLITLAKNRLTGMTPKVMCQMNDAKFTEKFTSESILIE